MRRRSKNGGSSQATRLGLFLLCSLIFIKAADAAITCTISMTTIAFGSVDVTTGNPFTTTGTMTISCSGAAANSTPRACLSIDKGSAGDATSREMLNGANTLRFDLYSDAAMTQLWGSYVSGWDVGGIQIDFTTNSSGAANFTETVYAKLFGSQTSVVPGSYSSTFSASPQMYYQKDQKNTCPNLSQSTSSSFVTTAVVTGSCSTTATNLNFGSIGSLAANVDGTSTLTVTCASGTPYSIGLGAGNAPGATVTTRAMTNSATTVGYSLYSNSGRTTNWGNTVGTDTVSGTGSGAGQNYTVYGRIPAQATPAPATYSDTIVVTVTY